MSCGDSGRCTCSAASADGRSRSSGRVGPQMLLFGPDPAPASRSAAPANSGAKATSDTSGPSCAGSSGSACLQSSLESRLRARLGGRGAPEYTLTWKHWDLTSGLRICALRASAPRTSGSGCSGWPTTAAADARNTRNATSRSFIGREPAPHETEITGWATATSRDWKDSPGMNLLREDADGTVRSRADQLPRQAGTIRDDSIGSIPSRPDQLLRKAGTTSDSSDASSPLVTADDARDGVAPLLNHRFSLWLMGYPDT